MSDRKTLFDLREQYANQINDHATKKMHGRIFAGLGAGTVLGAAAGGLMTRNLSGALHGAAIGGFAGTSGGLFHAISRVERDADEFTSKNNFADIASAKLGRKVGISELRRTFDKDPAADMLAHLQIEKSKADGMLFKKASQLTDDEARRAGEINMEYRRDMSSQFAKKTAPWITLATTGSAFAGGMLGALPFSTPTARAAGAAAGALLGGSAGLIGSTLHYARNPNFVPKEGLQERYEKAFGRKIDPMMLRKVANSQEREEKALIHHGSKAGGRVRNGALIGGALGAVAGLPIAAMAIARKKPTLAPISLIPSALVYGGLGAGAGYVVHKLKKDADKAEFYQKNPMRKVAAVRSGKLVGQAVKRFSDLKGQVAAQTRQISALQAQANEGRNAMEALAKARAGLRTIPAPNLTGDSTVLRFSIGAGGAVLGGAATGLAMRKRDKE